LASGKVARRADAGEIAALLDSVEVAALIDQLGSVGDPRGRKGYGARALVGACLVKALYGLPTLRRVQLHANLTMLARLSQALERARAMQLAA
jgi:hypothetical protein